jgi:hypothetical protein
MVPALRAAPEPILVEELGMAGYTGHQLFVDSFVATRLSNLHRWDEGPLGNWFVYEPRQGGAR